MVIHVFLGTSLGRKVWCDPACAGWDIGQLLGGAVASAGEGTGEKKWPEPSSCLLRAGTPVTLPKSKGRALVAICVLMHGKGQKGGQSAAQRGMWASLNSGRGPGNGPLKK